MTDEEAFEALEVEARAWVLNREGFMIIRHTPVSYAWLGEERGSTVCFKVSVAVRPGPDHNPLTGITVVETYAMTLNRPHPNPTPEKP